MLQGAEKGTVRKLLTRLDAFDRERFAPSDVDEEAMNNAKDAASSLLTAIEKQTRAAMVEHGGES